MSIFDNARDNKVGFIFLEYIFRVLTGNPRCFDTVLLTVFRYASHSW